MQIQKFSKRGRRSRRILVEWRAYMHVLCHLSRHKASWILKFWELRYVMFFIDTSMLGINSSCLSIQCGNDSKLYGDIDCNNYLNTRCTDNSIGKYIWFIRYNYFTKRQEILFFKFFQNLIVVLWTDYTMKSIRHVK